MLHGVGNVIVVAMFAASWFLRRDEPSAPPMLAIIISGTAVVLALVTGWLGEELVARLAVGVDDGANLDAPSSLSGKANTFVSLRQEQSSASNPLPQ